VFNKTRILIADDHPIVRQGFVRIIGGDPAYSIVAECGNGNKARDLICDLKPDIAVLDISMPGMTGLDVVRWARDNGVACEFLILTMYRDEEYFEEAMDLDVKGYVLKECAVQELMSSLAAIKHRRHYFSPAFSEFFVRRNQRAAKHKGSKLDILTPTERRVFKLIGENLTSRQIADSLFVSYRTIQNHRFNICKKMGLKGHNRLLQFALEHKAEL